MKLSTEVTEIFKALSKFQGELENASKDKAGHGYKYADLGMVINAAKEHLANNGLAVTQLLGDLNGKRSLITMLTHSSGQYISSEVELEAANLQGGAGKNPVQVLGSAITYHRRYAYAAIIGLAQEDDNAADITKNKKPQEPVIIQTAQVIELRKLMTDTSSEEDAVISGLNLGIESIEQLPFGKFNFVKGALLKKAQQMPQ